MSGSVPFLVPRSWERNTRCTRATGEKRTKPATLKTIKKREMLHACADDLKMICRSCLLVEESDQEEVLAKVVG